MYYNYNMNVQPKEINMSKKTFVILGLLAIISGSVSAVFAEDVIYTDELGRMHFLGRGGYSSVRKIQMDEVQAGVVNDAVNKYSVPEKPVFKPLDEDSNEVPASVQQDTVQPQNIESDAMPQPQAQPAAAEKSTPELRDVIEEKPTVNKTKHKSSFTFKKGTMDASNPYNYGSTNIPDKTRYEKDKADFEAQKARYFGTPAENSELNRGPRSVNPAITPDRRF